MHISTHIPTTAAAAALLLLVACAPTEHPGPAPDVSKGAQASAKDKPAPAQPPAKKDDAPAKTLALDDAIGSSRLAYDMVGLGHLAVATTANHLKLDLGTASALQHTMGGWRAGWNPTTRKDGDTDYIEANKATARLAFKHRKGGFERVMLRMKAVQNAGKATVVLGGKKLGEAELKGQWTEYGFDVPQGATVDGENHLELQFKGSARVDGRPQHGHVDAVSFYSGDGGPAPQPLSLRPVTLGGKARAALQATAAGTWIWRAQLPLKDPSLVLAAGAVQASGRVVVTVQADGAAPVEMDLEVPKADAWTSKALDLKAMAGKVVEISLKVSGEVSDKAPLSIAGGVFGAPRAFKAIKPRKPAKHVVVYLIDTLRYDKIGVYNPKSSVKTPYFDAFAKDAAIFEAGYDAENWTKPSTATILTGLYPWNHRTKDGKSKLPESVTTLGEHLRAQKFRTGGFIANGYVSRKFGFGTGWDRYTNYIREKRVTDAGNLVDDALAWIDKQDQSRFFAYIHTIDPHVPYSAPWPWKLGHWEALGRGPYKGSLKAQNTGTQIADIKSGKLKPDGDDRAFFQALYDGEVAYNDNEFGRLLEGLKKRGIYDETLIIVLADHGEEFWDHGSVGHGHSLYDEMVHTPLIVRHPGTTPAGVRLPEVVSTAAMVPSVLDVLGVAPMEGLDALSWMEIFEGGEVARPGVALTDFMYRQKSIRVGRVHWLTNGTKGPLYDVVADPGETKDLSATHPIALAFARAHFGFFMGASDHARWWVDQARAKRQAPAEEVADIDDELARQLEAMGYIEGATSEHSPEEDRKIMEKEDGSKAP